MWIGKENGSFYLRLHCSWHIPFGWLLNPGRVFRRKWKFHPLSFSSQFNIFISGILFNKACPIPQLELAFSHLLLFLHSSLLHELVDIKHVIITTNTRNVGKNMKNISITIHLPRSILHLTRTTSENKMITTDYSTYPNSQQLPTNYCLYT